MRRRSEMFGGRPAGDADVKAACYLGAGVSGAVFSDCRTYRYTLWRRWVQPDDACRLVAFVGLNPSTADETANDPTVRRCIGFAKHWKFDGMIMLNIFAFRATDPKEMKSTPLDPLGVPENNQAICECAGIAEQTICCWGTHGDYLERGHDVEQLLTRCTDEVYHLGLTKSGFPKHPLYLRADTPRTRLVR